MGRTDTADIPDREIDLVMRSILHAFDQEPWETCVLQIAASAGNLSFNEASIWRISAKVFENAGFLRKTGIHFFASRFRSRA